MECNELPLVSSDFNGYPVSCVVDLNHTRVQGDLVKVLAWYDNEWAFANRMLDVMLAGLSQPHVTFSTDRFARHLHRACHGQDRRYAGIIAAF